MTNVVELRPGTNSQRSERIIERNQYWYYKTREGVEIGPYDSHTDASIGVREFINYILRVNPAVIRILSAYRRLA